MLKTSTEERLQIKYQKQKSLQVIQELKGFFLSCGLCFGVAVLSFQCSVFSVKFQT